MVLINDKPLQQIYFGAPGTGKSHEIKEQIKRYYGRGAGVINPPVEIEDFKYGYPCQMFYIKTSEEYNLLGILGIIDVNKINPVGIIPIIDPETLGITYENLSKVVISPIDTPKLSETNPRSNFWNPCHICPL